MYSPRNRKITAYSCTNCEKEYYSIIMKRFNKRFLPFFP